jgi:hypothetical protein
MTLTFTPEQLVILGDCIMGKAPPYIAVQMINDINRQIAEASDERPAA